MKRLLLLLFLLPLMVRAQYPDSAKKLTPNLHPLSFSSLSATGGNTSNNAVMYFDITTGKWNGLATAYSLWSAVNTASGLYKLKSDTTGNQGFTTLWHFNNNTGTSTVNLINTLLLFYELKSNKTAIASTNTTTYPNWLGVENYAAPISGSPNYLQVVNNLSDVANATKSLANISGATKSVGLLYGKSYWTGFTDFTVSGFSPSLSNNNIHFSGGANTNTQTMAVNGLTSSDENLDIEVVFTIDTVGDGIGVGRKSISTAAPRTAWVQYDITNNLVNIHSNYSGHTGSDTTVLSQPSGITVAVGDNCTLTYSQRGNILTAIFSDNTKSYTVRYSVINELLASNVVNWHTWELPNTSNPALWNFGGGFDINKITITSATPFKPNIAHETDSKSRVSGIALQTTYPNLLVKLGRFAVFSGSADALAQSLAGLPYIINYIKPTNLLLLGGRNDLAFGTDTTVWHTQYRSLVSTAQAAGIKVFLLRPFPELVIPDQSSINTFLDGNFPASMIIDGSTGINATTNTSAEHIHLNVDGMRKAANNILAANKIDTLKEINNIPVQLVQPITLTGDVTGSGQSVITTTYSGNLPVSKLNSGTSASSSTFWRGDGTWGTPAGSGGTVTSVSGTSNRITSTGGTAPVIDISSTFESLLGKVANPLSQFAATTSSQLAGVISDETGSGSLVFGSSPTLITPALGTPSALVGTNISGTGASFTAGHVTTNANLTGPITSSGNTTSIGAQTGTGTTFAMSVTPTFNSYINIGDSSTPYGQLFFNNAGVNDWQIGTYVGAANNDFKFYNSAIGTAWSINKSTNQASFLYQINGTAAVFSGNLSASLPAYSSGTNLPVVYNSTNNRFETGTAGGITGSGTTNYISKFTSSSAIGNSGLFDNGTFAGIDYTSDPSSGNRFAVNGSTFIGGTLTANVGIQSNGNITSTGNFIKTGGTSSQVLLADGSIGTYTGVILHGNSTTTGTATTAVTVTIGATQANTNYFVTITPQDLLTAVNYYVSAKTTTTFTITFVTALTGSINFDWSLIP